MNTTTGSKTDKTVKKRDTDVETHLVVDMHKVGSSKDLLKLISNSKLAAKMFAKIEIFEGGTAEIGTTPPQFFDLVNSDGPDDARDRLLVAYANENPLYVERIVKAYGIDEKGTIKDIGPLFRATEGVVEMKGAIEIVEAASTVLGQETNDPSMRMPQPASRRPMVQYFRTEQGVIALSHKTKLGVDLVDFDPVTGKLYGVRMEEGRGASIVLLDVNKALANERVIADMSAWQIAAGSPEGRSIIGISRAQLKEGKLFMTATFADGKEADLWISLKAGEKAQWSSLLRSTNVVRIGTVAGRSDLLATYEAALKSSTLTFQSATA